MAAEMPDAGDEAAAQINANASWHNYRRGNLPPLVNEYCAVTTSEIIRWQSQLLPPLAPSTPILNVPSTNVDFNTIYWVFPYFQSTAPQSRSNYGVITLAQLENNADMISRLRLTYDEYRIRSMKFIFEPVLTQPLTNSQPLECYAWFPPNPLALDLNNPSGEYSDWDSLRNDIRGGNKDFRRMCSVFGQKFTCEFIPQCYVQNQVGGPGQAPVNTASLVPAPWLNRSQNGVTFYTPIFTFRQPFLNAGGGDFPYGFQYQVTLKACIEFRKPNPNEEA